MPKASNIFKTFSDKVNTLANKKAIIFSSPSGEYAAINYSQLFQKIIKLGNILANLGIAKDNKIAILLENQPEYPIVFFAAMYLGAVAVPLDAQFDAEQINQLILHSESKILITNKKIYGSIKKNLPDVEIIIADSEAFQEQLENYSGENEFKNIEGENRLAALFYTSGTTELPKAVMLTHRNLLTNTNSIEQAGIMTKDDIVLSILPMHHTYPFTVSMLSPLLTGAAITYPLSLSSANLLSAMKETKTTIFVGVPQILAILHHSIKEKLNAFILPKRSVISALSEISFVLRNSFNFNMGKRIFADIHKPFGENLRFITSGGARLDPDIATDFFKWGFTILEGYGLTETSPVVTFNPLEKQKIGSVGKPISGVEIKITAPTKDAIGEVAIKGDNVMAGYFNMPRQTKEVLKDGWFFSGDLGYIDKEGYLYLTGRKKEIIVLSNGKNINPEEIEKHYEQTPYIKEICVLPIKATGFLKGVENLSAIIVIDEEYFKAKNESGIRNKIKWELDSFSAKLPSYKRIRGFTISTTPLPRTRLGKIMRHKIEHLYAELLQNTSQKHEYLSQEEINILYSEISQDAMAFLKETLKKNININDHLELDLGLDSLGRVELLLGLQQRLNLELNDDDAMDFFMSHTVKGLLTKLKNIMPDIVQQHKEQAVFLWEKALKDAPSSHTLNRLSLKLGIGNIIISFIIIFAFKIFFRIFFLLRVQGKNNLPEKGPYLICPNHTSYLDGLIVLSSLPFKTALNTYFVGYSMIFEHFLLKWLIKTARLIPLEISLNLVETLKTCAYVLRNNKNLCYFPEGQRSIDEEIKEFRKGVGILIKELNIPVVPVYIDGAFSAWPRSRKLPRLSKIKLTFGKMLNPNELAADVENGKGEAIYKQLATALQTKVAEMKPAKINSTQIK